MADDGFYVVGAGGHGRVVADVIRELGLSVIGFVDADAAKVGHRVDSCGSRVVLLDAELRERVGLEPGRHRVALGIGDNHRRMHAYGVMVNAILPPLVHPRASVSRSVKIGDGTVVCANAVINAEALIGPAVIVNSAAVVEHDCQISEGAHISPGAILSGGVQVGAGAWVGAGACVLPGVKIGASAVVGAGAVVRKDVAQGTTVVGVPARFLR